jgi:hypothetical protein
MGRNGESISPGAAILVVGGALLATATHGSLWEMHDRPDSALPQVVFGDDTVGETTVPASSVPTTSTPEAASTATLEPRDEVVTSLAPGASIEQVQAVLRAAGRQELWCSNKALDVSSEDLAQTQELPNGTTLEITVPDDVQTIARVCLNETTIEVRENFDGDERYVLAFMRTDPEIVQREGAPSIFLAFKQDGGAIEDCIDAKEQMRDLLYDDLEAILGRTASANYGIEIHVDRRNLGHPCDDSLLDP